MPGSTIPYWEIFTKYVYPESFRSEVKGIFHRAGLEIFRFGPCPEGGSQPLSKNLGTFQIVVIISNTSFGEKKMPFYVGAVEVPFNFGAFKYKFCKKNTF